jgi:predicted DCC family thiol-disulfide oxidoreductase YuxK
MKKLTILYDASCGICRECRDWLKDQPTFLELELIPLQELDLEKRFPGIEKYRIVEQLLVIDDERAVYQGADAWIMALYALREYRELSLRLSHPLLKPLARKAYETVARNRHALSGLLGKKGQAADEVLKSKLEAWDSSRWLCQCDGECKPGVLNREKKAA